MDEFENLHLLHLHIDLAVLVLTWSAENIHRRLFNAASHHLVNVEIEGLKAFDPEGFAIYQAIWERLNSEGNIDTSIEHLSEVEAIQIAEKLAEVDARLDYFLGDVT